MVNTDLKSLTKKKKKKKARIKNKGLKCSTAELVAQVGLERERASLQELEKRFVTEGLEGAGV
jgi:hypothetical protein